MATTTKRVVFPKHFPVIEKNHQCPVKEAMAVVEEKSRCNCSTCYLKLPKSGRTMEMDEVLANCLDEIEEEETFEVVDKNAPPPQKESGGCCLLM